MSFRPVSILALCALAACSIHKSRSVPKYDIETISKTLSYSGSSFSPDGTRILLTSNESGVFNVYSLPVEGGDKQQLTFSKTNAVRGITWIDNERFLYTSDQGGNELNHIYVGSTRGTAAIDLTPGTKHRARFAGMDRDRKRLLIYTNERNPRFFDVYRYDLTAKESESGAHSYPRERIFTNDQGFQPGTTSDDLRYVAMNKTTSNKNSDVYLWDAESPKAAPRLILSDKAEVSFAPSAFSPDGKTLFYTTDLGGEFRKLCSYDLTSRMTKVVTERSWDVTTTAYTADRRYRVIAVNENARRKVEVFDAKTGAAVALPKIPGRDIYSFSVSRDGKTIAMYAGGSHTPSDLYLGKTANWSVSKRTTSLPKEIDERDLVRATTIKYPSFDGLQIPAILFRPHQASASTPVPALVWVHGGPGGQSRQTYRPTIQYLVNHGFAVLMVNNRGSSGYGKTFYHLDDRRHGEDDLQDCIYGRRYLESLDWVRGDKVGIIGGSYGGYMVAAALAFAPESFECGVDIFGVTNWLRTLESIPAWWTAQRDALYAELGDPKTDRERLRRISPLFHADKIRRPLLVVQGANDPRVLKVESDELVAAVKKNGVPCEYLVFDDEGHGFRRRENSMAADRKYLEFLERYLK